MIRKYHKFGKKVEEGFYRNKSVFQNSYSFSIVSANKILKYLFNQAINKATGLDGIPSRFVRDGALIIACPLTRY